MANKKYHIELRLANPGPVKYLIDCWEKDDFMEAFHFAKDRAQKLDSEHFIEIVEVDTGATVISFNEKRSKQARC